MVFPFFLFELFISWRSHAKRVVNSLQKKFERAGQTDRHWTQTHGNGNPKNHFLNNLVSSNKNKDWMDNISFPAKKKQMICKFCKHWTTVDKYTYKHLMWFLLFSICLEAQTWCTRLAHSYCVTQCNSDQQTECWFSYATNFILFAMCILWALIYILQFIYAMCSEMIVIECNRRY